MRIPRKRCSSWRRRSGSLGRNPPKTNWSSRVSSTERAAMNDAAPGTGTTGSSNRLTSRISTAPGSAKTGVPQSEISAKDSPLAMRMASSAAFSISLCSFNSIKGLSVISSRFSSVEAGRISSQITASTWRSVSSARKVISRTLPIGTATIYSVPGDFICLFRAWIRGLFAIFSKAFPFWERIQMPEGKAAWLPGQLLIRMQY